MKHLLHQSDHHVHRSSRGDPQVPSTGTIRTRRRRVPELQQMDATECGAACLAMILNYYGRKTSVAETRDHCGVGRDGLSALTIVKAARAYGLRVKALSLQRNDFRFVTLPAIVHWKFNHFLVIERWSKHYVDVVDPALGRRRMNTDEFDEGFTGILIMLEPGVQFSYENNTTHISLWSYLKYTFYFRGFIAQIVVVSVLLQFIGLGLPLFTKVFVDNIIPSHFNALLPLMAAGILFLATTQFVITQLRASLLIYIQARVDTQMMLGFFEHLLTLPYRFFQQRSSGDLLARLNSNLTIRDMFTNQMISAFLDGSSVILYLFILFFISQVIGLFALVFGLVQIGLLLLTSRAIHTLTRRDLIAQGKAQGYMAEALGGIATLKSTGMEHRAFHQWSNLFFEHLNVSVRRDLQASLLSSVLSTLNILAPLALLWIGTSLVLKDSLTMGTMLALNSLAASFLTPLSSLASSAQKFQLIRAHFERIADVVSAEPEQDIQSVQQPPLLSGLIEFKHVSFQYDPNAPLVLRDITLTVRPGQKIALVGRTGSGKSTLGKLLLGLYSPTSGEIIYDGIPLQHLNYRALRNQFGVVLQESSIFSGSIRDNIAFSEPAMDMEQVIKAAKLAAIHDEILTMPMGYETFVSEGGSALSGGQRQRLSLARAVASSPTLLLLDESTSHLDVITEQVVDQNLNELACTRLVIAHRLSTIQNADLILVMNEGGIVEQGTNEELLSKNSYYANLLRNQLFEKQVKAQA